MNAPKCRDCGAVCVWRQSKAGKWYLADEYRGPRGSVHYMPHRQDCPVANRARNEQILADEAAYRAEVREHMVWNGQEYIDNRNGQPWAVQMKGK